MARTPLMDLVLRALRTARGASAEELPVAEYRELRRAQLPQVSRRGFLHLAAGTAGAATLAACGRPEPFLKESPSGQSVVIVGAGIAGLHCAHRLRRAAVVAQVYDAAKRTGGRIFTERRLFDEGQSCELGGELIDTGHDTMRDLAEELGIELLDYHHDDPGLSPLVAHFGGRTLSEQELLQGFMPIVDKIDEALRTLDDPYEVPTYLKPNGAEALDQLSIRAWLDQQGIPASDPVRQLIEVAYTGEFGLETDDSSCLNLLTYISRDTQYVELLGGSDERFRAKDGNDIFTQRLTEALEPSQLHLEQRLVRLEELSDGRYQLTFQGPGGTQEVKADHVVLALPFTLLREVELRVTMSEVKRKAIAELGYGTNAKLMVGFSQRLWRTRYRSNGSTYSDVGYMQTWETSRLQPGASGIITHYTGGQRGLALGNGTPEQQAAEFMEGFNRVFPGVSVASNGRVARMQWPAFPFTKGSYSAYKVGQYTRLAGAEGEREGNLHFCGEHTSLDAQGFMEGGALTGAMAATEVGGDLGLRMEQGMAPGGRITSRAFEARRYGRWLTGLRQRMARRRQAG
jgi:monoamine oxidase